MNTTILDTLGRSWTIMTKVAVVGFRWRVYVHFSDCKPDGLELLYPGGVAHGWTDDDPHDDAPLVLLRAIMATKGASEAGREPAPDDLRETLSNLGAPACSVLRTLLVLTQAADHLESALGWDGHGWETVHRAVRAGAAYLAGRIPGDEDFVCGPPTADVLAIRGKPFGLTSSGEPQPPPPETSPG